LPPRRLPLRRPPLQKLPPLWKLDLVEMLGHKGESYSKAIVKLGFQLMAMRLTAKQAVNARRSFK
jgi:hypothetical protein